MSNNDLSPWYYDYLDQIANLELKNKPAHQGGTQLRYTIARDKQKGRPLSGQIAKALLPRLEDACVVLVTGTGNPDWLPHGETDGPSGVAVLARCLGAMGVQTCVLSEARFLPGVRASVQAAGVPLLEESAWRKRTNGALCLEFPTGADAAAPFIDDLMKRLPRLAAAIFIEKPGPGREGRFHNSSGKPKASNWVSHAHLLVEAARKQEALTIGVGDGGNEIGFGLIARELAANVNHGFACDCGCELGLLDATDVDFLFPAAVSNWGAYAIGAALALASRRFLMLPDWEEVGRSISASIAFGAFDGYSGLAIPTVDGTSADANRAIYTLIQEVLKLARESESG